MAQLGCHGWVAQVVWHNCGGTDVVVQKRKRMVAKQCIVQTLVGFQLAWGAKLAQLRWHKWSGTHRLAHSQHCTCVAQLRMVPQLVGTNGAHDFSAGFHTSLVDDPRAVDLESNGKEETVCYFQAPVTASQYVRRRTLC